MDRHPQHASAITTSLEAICRSRQATREQAWPLADPRSQAPCASAKTALVIDLDATLFAAHSEKDQSAPTYKRFYGYPAHQPNQPSG